MLFGCATTNFGTLSRGQPHSPHVNHCVIQFQPEGHREPCNKLGFLSLVKCLVDFEPGTFQFYHIALTHQRTFPKPCPEAVTRSIFWYHDRVMCDMQKQPPEVLGLRPITLLKKRLWHRCFPLNFAEFLRTHFVMEHFWWLLLNVTHDSIMISRKLSYQLQQAFFFQLQIGFLS